MSIHRIHAGIQLPVIPQNLILPATMSSIREWEGLSARTREEHAKSFKEAWNPTDPTKITGHPWFPVLGNLTVCDFNAAGEEDE